MYEIKRGNRFRKSYKRISNSKGFPQEKLDHVFSLLEQGKELPDHYYDHGLTGKFLGLRECHLAGDCLLVYEINHDYKYVRLVNIGNHANVLE